MTRRVSVCVLALFSACTIALSTPVWAQGTPSCTVAPGGRQPEDACRKAQDLFAFIAPQIGALVVGGNHVLGQGSAVGGAAARTIGFKVTALSAQLPRDAVPIVTESGAQASNFGSTSQLIPAVSMDLALGILPGFPMALTNVLGVDILAGVTYLPPIKQGLFELKPKQAVSLNYGVRVGLLQESALMPGLGLSYMRKQLPRFDMLYLPADDSLRATNTQVRANSFRATVSKGYWLLGFVLGAGHDRVESLTDVSAVVMDGAQRVTVSSPLVVQRITRNTVFINTSLGLRRARVTAELGWSGGGKRSALNSFGTSDINGGAQYASLGVGFRF